MTEPPRVLHLVTLLSSDGRYGGPQAVARTLADRFGHEIWGSATAADLRAEPTDRTNERRFRAYPLAGARASALFVPALWAALWRLTGKRSASRPDVLHLHTGPELTGLGSLLVLVLRRAPFIVQTHGMFSYRGAAAGRAGVVRRLLVPLIRRARAVVALTDVERQDLIALGFAPDFVVTIANGIDITGRPAQPFDEADAAADLPKVAFVGRLHPRKHPERFTEACSLLAARGVKARFVVAGDDQGALAAARAADPSGVVSFLGALTPPQARGVFVGAAVAVMCSDLEPFGLVALEALDAGAALAVTDSCDLASELGAAGAATVTSVEPTALADGIAALLADQDRAAAQVTAGHALIADRYSMDVIAPRWQDLYRRSTSPSASPSAGKA